jgi:hypothetical protein
VAREAGVDPFADVETARLWAATAYVRLLTLPNSAELMLFGLMFQDPNMGSDQLLPMILTGASNLALYTMPLAQIANLREPPTWPCGSLTAASRMAGYAYAMMTCGLFPADVAADESPTKISIAVIKDGVGTPVSIDLGWTFAGDLRLRVPIPAKHLGCIIAIPLKEQLSCGLIRALALQRGANVLAAIQDRYTHPLPRRDFRVLRGVVHGSYFCAQAPDAHLLVTVEENVRSALTPSDTDVVVLTIVITPLPVDVAEPPAAETTEAASVG